MANVKKYMGQVIAFGYLAVLMFHVYLFYHYVGETLHGPNHSPNKKPPFTSLNSSRQMALPSTEKQQLSPKPMKVLELAIKQSYESPISYDFGKTNQTKDTGDIPNSLALAGKDGENATTNPGLSRNGDKDAQGGEDAFSPGLALCIEFVSGYGLCLCTYLAWMIGMRKQCQFIYHLAVAAIVTAVIGLFSAAAWSSSLDDEFEKEWEFWPYTISYIFILAAVIPLMTLEPAPRRHRPRRGPHRMTEAEWRRWQHVQARTRQVDEIVEAAGGGDIMYSPNPDGSWRLTRWRSESQDETTVELMSTEVEMERGREGHAAMNSAALPEEATHRSPEKATHLATLSPATSGVGHSDPEVLLVIPGNQPPSAASRNPVTTLRTETEQSNTRQGPATLRSLSDSEHQASTSMPSSTQPVSDVNSAQIPSNTASTDETSTKSPGIEHPEGSLDNTDVAPAGNNTNVAPAGNNTNVAPSENNTNVAPAESDTDAAPAENNTNVAPAGNNTSLATAENNIGMAQSVSTESPKTSPPVRCPSNASTLDTLYSPTQSPSELEAMDPSNAATNATTNATMFSSIQSPQDLDTCLERIASNARSTMPTEFSLEELLSPSLPLPGILPQSDLVLSPPVGLDLDFPVGRHCSSSLPRDLVLDLDSNPTTPLALPPQPAPPSCTIDLEDIVAAFYSADEEDTSDEVEKMCNENRDDGYEEESESSPLLSSASRKTSYS